MFLHCTTTRPQFHCASDVCRSSSFQIQRRNDSKKPPARPEGNAVNASATDSSGNDAPKGAVDSKGAAAADSNKAIAPASTGSAAGVSTGAGAAPGTGAAAADGPEACAAGGTEGTGAGTAAGANAGASAAADGTEKLGGCRCGHRGGIGTRTGAIARTDARPAVGTDAGADAAPGIAIGAAGTTAAAGTAGAAAAEAGAISGTGADAAAAASTDAGAFPGKADDFEKADDGFSTAGSVIGAGTGVLAARAPSVAVEGLEDEGRTGERVLSGLSGGVKLSLALP